MFHKVFGKELFLYIAGLVSFTIMVPEFLSLAFTGEKLGDSPDFGLGLFSLILMIAIAFNVARRSDYFNNKFAIKLIIVNLLYVFFSLLYLYLIYKDRVFERIPLILMVIMSISTMAGWLFNKNRGNNMETNNFNL